MTEQADSYWLASDGNWYPPELHPANAGAPAQPAPVGPNSTVKPLRYGGPCRSCGEEIAVRAKGWHDPDTKTVTCLACRPPDLPPQAAPAQALPAHAASAPVAGTSALGLGRKRSRSEKKMNAYKGAAGEYLLAQSLHNSLSNGEVILEDRAVPGDDANIDAVVVASSGIWVIDAKNWSGKIAVQDKGGPLGRDLHLTVDGRDRTDLTAAIYRYMVPVRNVVGDWSVPIHPAICFVNGDWTGVAVRGLTNKPYQINNVWVTWPRALSAAIALPGPLTPTQVSALAAHLDASLPPRSR